MVYSSKQGWFTCERAQNGELGINVCANRNEQAQYNKDGLKSFPKSSMVFEVSLISRQKAVLHK